MPGILTGRLQLLKMIEAGLFFELFEDPLQTNLEVRAVLELTEGGIFITRSSLQSAGLR